MKYILDTATAPAWYVPYLAPMVVLLTFSFNIWLTYRVRKVELKRNWYMKVFIEPNNTKIAAYFEGILTIINDTAKTISASIANPNPLVLQRIQLTAISEFQDLKQKFEFEVIQPIEITYSFKANMPSKWLMDIEDAYAKYLSLMAQATYSTAIPNLKTQLINELSSYRANLVKAINHPLTGRNTLFN